MLSLMNRALQPSSSFPDKITYLTSLHHLQSIRSDNTFTSVEKIKDLLSSSTSRLHGLELLEIALKQNPDIYLKARWAVMLIGIIKDPGASILKEHACRILCMIIPYMAKDPASNKYDWKKLATDLFPFLLDRVEDDVEWSEAACKCIYACIKYIPPTVESNRILKIVLKHVTTSVSSRTFEIITDIFSELPNYRRIHDPQVYQEAWLSQYCTTLNTMQRVLNTFLTFLKDDSCLDEEINFNNYGVYQFDDDDKIKDVYEAYMKAVRRYINLSRCLGKMLSTKSRYAVQAPVKETFSCLYRLFDQEMAKIKVTSIEMQIFCSTLSQMQISNLIVLESLILNFNLVPYSAVMAQLLLQALQSSSLVNISPEPVSQLRLSIWTYLNKWISKYGNKVCGDIVNPQLGLIEELLKDISFDDSESSQENTIQTSSKAKKNISTSLANKNYLNKINQKVCKEALKTLENLVYAGMNHITKKMFQEMFSKVSQVTEALFMSFDSFLFPYDDESCRKHLYSVILAFTINSKTNQREPIQTASRVFKRAQRDPSVKISRFCHKAIATCRLFLHPKKPIPEIKNTEVNKRLIVSREMGKYSQWSSDDFVPNLPLESLKIDENSRISRTSHNLNDSAELNQEPMEDDVQEESHYSDLVYQEYSEQYITKYSDQSAESQRNGEDMLERNSNQCHDDMESGDEDEDEDEEEEEERSYEDEEISQVDITPEEIFIPSTSKMPVISTVEINPQTVSQTASEPEYDELRHVKTESTIVSNKNSQLNGVVPDEEVQIPDEDVPSSTPSFANENGLYGDEEEEEDEEEDEDDLENRPESFPAEKRAPDFYPPSKKQKLETDKLQDNSQDEEMDRNSRSPSPSLSDMKEDFILEKKTDCSSDINNAAS